MGSDPTLINGNPRWSSWSLTGSDRRVLFRSTSVDKVHRREDSERSASQLDNGLQFEMSRVLVVEPISYQLFANTEVSARFQQTKRRAIDADLSGAKQIASMAIDRRNVLDPAYCHRSGSGRFISPKPRYPYQITRST